MPNNTNKILKNATKLPSKQSKHTNYSKHKSTKLKVKKLKKSQKHKKAVDLIKCDSSSNDNKVKLIKSVTDNSTSWINEQRLLIFSSRGISCLARHVMKNLNGLLPHSRCGAKLDTKRDLNVVIKENMDERNCNKVLFFEMRKKKDLYLWAAAGPDGPTVKFFVQNVHSMEELRMTGNCLRASRPILSFDKRFEETKNNVHLTLIKELLVQCFGCPKNHPRSQPFIDHVFTFSWIDGRIWFRNYQIIDSKLGKLAEIGPRFCMQPILIQEKLFGGRLLYKNHMYISPNLLRRMQSQQNKQKGRLYGSKIVEKVKREERVPEEWPTNKRDIVDSIFK